MMRLRFLLLSVLFLALLRPVPAHAQEVGTIEGRVTLAADEPLPPGLEVELLFLPNGQGPPVITAQPLGPDGSFRFDTVDTGPQHRYLVRVTAEGEDTLSELLAFAPDETTKQVTLQLFARTTDASALSLPQVNYVLDPQPEGWFVAVLYRYVNAGDQVIENLTNPPAQVPLPADAVALRFSEGVNLQNLGEIPAGFTYAGPFSPGDTPIIFSFVLPYQAGEQVLSLPVAPTAEGVRLLVPQVGQTTSSDDLSSAGVQELEGRTFELFESAGDPPEVVTLRLSGLPPAPTPAPGSTSGTGATGPSVVPVSPLERLPWWAALVPVALAVGGVAAYLAARPAPSAAEQRAALRERRDTLVAEIAALDIRFEANGIGEQTHQRQRQRLKQELKEVLRRLGTDVPAGD